MGLTTPPPARAERNDKMGIGAQMVAAMIAKAEGKTVKPLKEKKKAPPVQSVGGQMVLKMIEAYEKNIEH